MEQRIQRIGLRIPSWFMMQDAILLGIVDYVREHNKAWQIEVPRGSDGELPEVLINAQWSGDGLISFRYTAEEVHAFRQRGIECLNLSSVNHPGVATVIPNNKLGGAIAARHLLNIGLVDTSYGDHRDRQGLHGFLKS